MFLLHTHVHTRNNTNNNEAGGGNGGVYDGSEAIKTQPPVNEGLLGVLVGAIDTTKQGGHSH